MLESRGPWAVLLFKCKNESKRARARKRERKGWKALARLRKQKKKTTRRKKRRRWQKKNMRKRDNAWVKRTSSVSFASSSGALARSCFSLAFNPSRVAPRFFQEQPKGHQPLSTKAQSIKYSKKPARIRAVLLPPDPSAPLAIPPSVFSGSFPAPRFHQPQRATNGGWGCSEK